MPGSKAPRGARPALSAFPIGIAYDARDADPAAPFFSDRMFTPAYLKFLSAIVQQTIFVFLLVGSVFALAAGLLLLFDSDRAFRISERMNRWVSTRSLLRPLEEQRSIARPLYRMHRLVGALICAGALYALIVLATPYGGLAITKSLSGLGPKPLVSWLSESLRIALVLGNVGALIFGIVFIVRPSALKGFEAWADRRISARQAAKPIEQVRLGTDTFARQHPRLLGSIVTLGSLYVMMNLAFVLFTGK
jgi:hypothetical protein